VGTVNRLQGLQVVDRVTLVAELDPYLSVGAAAQYTSLSPRTLRGLLSDLAHPLPHHRVGARVLLRRSDLDGYLAQHRRVGTPLEARIERLRAKRT